MVLFRKKITDPSLPKRFWNTEELTDQERSEQRNRQYYHNLKGPEFKKLITKYLTPRLRELGFSGSGFNFRKQSGNYIHAIQIHGNKYGGEA